MADFTTLAPAELVRQLGRPEGAVGVDIALRMNQLNAKVNEAVYSCLDLAEGMDVLEIGFGNGRLLPSLMRRADGLNYVGVDISPTMVEEAGRFNAPLIAAGQAAFHLADAERLPAADASLDRVFAVNVIYFWTDPPRQLAEIRRVLKVDGFSVVAASSPEITALMPVLRPEFGSHARDAATLVAMHKAAGFGRVDVELVTETVTRPEGDPAPVNVYIIVARP
ncbi:MAG: class I SAM-dependent methyltransferase [Roseiarcus sp.]|jgi:SAM-dependent methyltransferase